MAETKRMIRFFTIADYEEEEQWLREQHNLGWKLEKMTPPCFYSFTSCEPEDVIYKLAFTNGSENQDYLQMLQDYGWEYSGQCIGWLYFKKPAEQITDENEGELFSDKASRLDMVQKVILRRMLPLTVIFLCAVLPEAARAISGKYGGTFITAFWMIMMVIYVYLIGHSGIKLIKKRKELER